jgi:hypothetical protein
MASGLFDNGRNRFARGDVLWKASAGSTIKAALIDSAVTAPNLSTHTTMSDLRTAVVGSDTAMTLIDPAAGACDADDVVFSSVTGAHVEGVVFYQEVSASDASRFLLGWVEFTAVTPNGGNITIQWQGTTPFVFKL